MPEVEVFDTAFRNLMPFVNRTCLAANVLTRASPNWPVYFDQLSRHSPIYDLILLSRTYHAPDNHPNVAQQVAAANFAAGTAEFLFDDETCRALGVGTGGGSSQENGLACRCVRPVAVTQSRGVLYGGGRQLGASRWSVAGLAPAKADRAWALGPFEGAAGRPRATSAAT